MTAVFLVLFFLSLAGIIYMIGAKLILLEEQGVTFQKDFSTRIPDIQEIRYLAVKNAKKYGFIILVITIRFSVLSSHYLKNKYKILKQKAIQKIKDYTSKKEAEIKTREVSGFLKTISDYKKKVRQIKHKIKEQEGIE